MPTRQEHWRRVYSAKQSDEVSWFQREPVQSLRMVEDAGLTPST